MELRENTLEVDLRKVGHFNQSDGEFEEVGQLNVLKISRDFSVTEEQAISIIGFDDFFCKFPYNIYGSILK